MLLVHGSIGSGNSGGYFVYANLEWETEAKADTANAAYFESRMHELRERLSAATDFKVVLKP